VISCDGTDLSTDAHKSLREMRVLHQIGVPSHVRLEFSLVARDSGMQPPPVGIGNALTITVDGTDDLGNAVSDWTVFDGVVTSVGIDLDTGTTQIFVVEGYDRLYTLGRTSLVQTQLEQKPSDIIRELVPSGLTPQIDAAVDTAAAFPAAYQFGTAYQCIERLVRDAGCEWKVVGTDLHITQRDTTATATHTLTVGENLLGFSARFSAAEHVADVEVTGWDPATKARIVGASSSSGTRAGSSLNGFSASDIASSTVGGTMLMSIPHPVRDQNHAELLANGIVADREASLLRARGEAEPNAALVPGAKLTLAGLLADWNGDYYCSGIEHVWGKTGSFRTFFEVGGNAPTSLIDVIGGGNRPTLHNMLGGLTIGLVSNNEDPDDLNRVKVTFPYLSDSEESAWARVMQPGGGASRGWTVIPEVGDEVVVGFEHGDIDHPFVLGGLTNGTDTAPHTAGGGIVENGEVVARTMTSRLGHEIFMADGSADDDQFVLVKTAGDEAVLNLAKTRVDLISAANPLKLQNDNGSIEIDADGNITITGASITLDASGDITVDGGANVNVTSGAAAKVEAGAALDLKASAPATLESSAITNVKGSMVKIN
jgi:uncharacterized protein involved in type VI secretion and phage assembly